MLKLAHGKVGDCGFRSDCFLLEMSLLTGQGYMENSVWQSANNDENILEKGSGFTYFERDNSVPLPQEVSNEC